MVTNSNTGKLVLVAGRRSQFFTMWTSPGGCGVLRTRLLASPRVSNPEKSHVQAITAFMTALEATHYCFLGMLLVAQLSSVRCGRVLHSVTNTRRQ